MWWLTLGVALLAPVVLLYTGLSMVRRLERLDRAVRRVRVNLAEAQTLQVAVARLQERLVAMADTLPAVRRPPPVEPPPVEPPAVGPPPAGPPPAGLRAAGAPHAHGLAGGAGGRRGTAAPDGPKRGDWHGWFSGVER
jgi:hypothetical protein